MSMNLKVGDVVRLYHDERKQYLTAQTAGGDSSTTNDFFALSPELVLVSDVKSTGDALTANDRFSFKTQIGGIDMFLCVSGQPLNSGVDVGLWPDGVGQGPFGSDTVKVPTYVEDGSALPLKSNESLRLLTDVRFNTPLTLAQHFDVGARAAKPEEVQLRAFFPGTTAFPATSSFQLRTSEFVTPVVLGSHYQLSTTTTSTAGDVTVSVQLRPDDADVGAPTSTNVLREHPDVSVWVNSNEFDSLKVAVKGLAVGAAGTVVEGTDEWGPDIQLLDLISGRFFAFDVGDDLRVRLLPFGAQLGGSFFQMKRRATTGELLIRPTPPTTPTTAPPMALGLGVTQSQLTLVPEANGLAFVFIAVDKDDFPVISPFKRNSSQTRTRQSSFSSQRNSPCPTVNTRFWARIQWELLAFRSRSHWSRR
jgi:hypothetical protein